MTDFIRGKVILITGASSGIGEATARLLAESGAKVVLGARRKCKLKKIVTDINRTGGLATCRELDVTKRSDNEAIVDLAIDAFGQLDAVLLNAGIMPRSPISALEVDNWDRMVDVNIKGLMYGIAAAMPRFVEQRSGHVLAVSSVAGQKSYAGAAVYGGTKWFVRNFMEVLRMESVAEGTNIKTTTLYPAAVRTELISLIDDKQTADEMRNFYDRFAVSPARIAETVAYALSLPFDTTINEITVGPTKQPW